MTRICCGTYSDLNLNDNIFEEEHDHVIINGNIQSLVNYSESCPNYCFYKLFKNCDIREIPEFSALSVGKYSYAYMFENCNNLLRAPYLPANKLSDGCYQGMFKNC